MPALRPYREAIVRVDINRQTTAAAVAIHRYYRERGQWPEQTSDLIPEFLRSFPCDPLNGQPLQYTVRPEGFIIYGLGHDGDDDGGERIMAETNPALLWEGSNKPKFSPQPASEFLFRRPNKPDDGDWVAWPRK